MHRWRYIVILFAMLGAAVLLPALGRAQDEQPNRAGLVIRHGDGSLVRACVSFSEPSISGLELLDRAGIGYLAQSGGTGAAVCKLDGEGCEYPAEDCFCRCKGADCIYWTYSRLFDGRWSYSQLGASATRVLPGGVEGWAWGQGSVQTGAQPPLVSFAEVCPAPGSEQPTSGEPAPPPPTEVPEPTQPPPPPPTEVPAPTQPPPATAQPTARPTRIAARATSTSQPTGAPSTTATDIPATAAPPPTETPQPTSGQAPATSRLPTASFVPTLAASATGQPAGAVVPTRATAPAPGGTGGPVGYLAFGVLALLMVGGIVAALIRRRGAAR